MGQLLPTAGRPSTSELPPRGVAPLDTRRLAAANNSNAPAPASTAVANPQTPGRHSRAINDSSQMRDTLGGAGISGAPSTRTSRPPTPLAAPGFGIFGGGGDAPNVSTSTPSSAGGGEPPTRLEQLRSALHQLEMQLAGVALSGRDTGSEAKYYALTKKLQRVRAEVLKEEREAGEVRRAQEEALANRAAKEEHRRMFRR